MEFETNIEAYFDIRPYLQVAHHIPGRIRLKLSVGAVSKLGNLAPGKMETLLRSLKGIKDIETNKAAGSAVVMYDPSVFSPSLWEILLNGDQEQVMNTIRNNLEKANEEQT